MISGRSPPASITLNRSFQAEESISVNSKTTPFCSAAYFQASFSSAGTFTAALRQTRMLKVTGSSASASAHWETRATTSTSANASFFIEFSSFNSSSTNPVPPRREQSGTISGSVPACQADTKFSHFHGRSQSVIRAQNMQSSDFWFPSYFAYSFLALRYCSGVTPSCFLNLRI